MTRLATTEPEVTVRGTKEERMAMLVAIEEGVTTLDTTAERTPMLGINEQHRLATTEDG